MSLEGMKTRLTYLGGAAQQDRMIKGKWKSMLSSLKYSYQAARFTKYPEMDKTYNGLFTPITHNMNYDNKQISIGFDSGFKVGDVFLWENTKTFWLCFTQDLTELAYFRGLCRRCDHKVRWVDGDKKVRETYLAITGPRQPDYRTYNPGYGLSIDDSTADLTVLVSDNEQNQKYFNQYQSFLLKGKSYSIHQMDNLSMPGVIRLCCTETKTNLIEDDVENNLKNNWNIQPVIPQYPTQEGIDGPLTIKPLFPATFSAVVHGGRWFILENQGNVPGKYLLPIEFGESVTQPTVTLTWKKPLSGAFTLCYELPDKTLFKRHIIVESLM